jgi:outer membrane protein TolC
VGVQMNVPLFSSQKQDDQVSASVLNTEAIRTDKRLQLRSLLTELQAAHENYMGIQKRKTNFDKRIIPHLSLQSELALNAYTNDQGNFYSVVTSKIEELDTKIERIKIEVAEQNALAQINYYLAGESYEQ